MRKIRASSLATGLGAAASAGSMIYALAQYWDSPSPDVCQEVTSITGDVPKGCGPVNWGPFWIIVVIAIALLVAGYFLRQRERAPERRMYLGIPPH